MGRLGRLATSLLKAPEPPHFFEDARFLELASRLLASRLSSTAALELFSEAGYILAPQELELLRARVLARTQQVTQQRRLAVEYQLLDEDQQDAVTAATLRQDSLHRIYRYLYADIQEQMERKAHLQSRQVHLLLKVADAAGAAARTVRDLDPVTRISAEATELLPPPVRLDPETGEVVLQIAANSAPPETGLLPPAELEW